MEKRGISIKVILICLILLLAIQYVNASSIDSEIQKLTHYAEEYETGNINYVQFLVYSSSIKQNINEILGATHKEMGGVLKQEQMRAVLGKPAEMTKWVWVENEEREIKLDKEVPAWRKIVFDGSKIQVRIDSWPSVFKKKDEELLFYRINFEVNFKRPEEQLDITGKISEIKTIAETFNKEPTRENGEALARASVNAEKLSQSYFEQNKDKCEDVMKSLFGTENQRETQKLIVNEISLVSEDKVEAKARVEFCDECEWNWVSFDIWLDTRGKVKIPQDSGEAFSKEQFKSLSSDNFKEAITKTIEEFKQQIKEKNYAGFFSLKNKVQMLNWAWNDKANNVWPEIDKLFESRRKEIEEKIKSGEIKDYDWAKEDQERREKEKELRKKNYEEIKQFYLNLFSGYEKKEYYFSQIEFEKRLVEEFKEFGEELCDNNKDDNNNGQIDCADEQCGGKLCGKKKVEIKKDNETIEDIKELYCISKECQPREEITEERKAVCGNHICEENETESCKEDCAICKQYAPLECNGKVIFKGEDKDGCPLEPICLEEKEFCKINEECIQPLCGKAECTEGKCQTIRLEECREEQCTSGDEKIQNCESGERIIVEKCIEGLWIKTDVKCEKAEKEEIEKPVVGEECSVKEDCGGENDVCSNGKCVAIPQAIEIPESQEQPSEQPAETPPGESVEQQASEPESQTETNQEPAEAPPAEAPPATGAIIQTIRELTKKIIGFIITGFSEEGETVPEQSAEQPAEPGQASETPHEQSTGSPSEPREQQQPTPEQPAEQPTQQEREQPREQTQEQGEERKPGGFEEEFKEEPKETPKEEKGVFKAGGMCRTAASKTESFIFFDGWGDPFEQIQQLKSKYYGGGEEDWCKVEFENIKKQRKDLEAGLNNEFAAWFFEKYLANSAEQWEQQVSGIFELYWKVVDNSRRIAEIMQCLGISEMPEHNLINVKYDTEYGSLEFWEEVKTTKLPGMENEVEIISPYMKIWIFPNKEFFKYEMKKAMKEHEFPGPAEEKQEREREEGPTAEEKEMIKQDKKFMNKVRKITEKYNGNLDAIIQFKDYNTSEIVFNLYVQINENDILKMEPMLPSEVPAQDVRAEIDFEKIYDLVYSMEKEMQGQQTESPPWDKKPKMGKIKEITNGVKMWFKVNSIMNSAKVEPESAKGEMKSLAKSFFYMMKKGEGGGQPGTEEEMGGEKVTEIEEGLWESKEEITGEVIRTI